MSAPKFWKLGTRWMNGDLEVLTKLNSSLKRTKPRRHRVYSISSPKSQESAALSMSSVIVRLKQEDRTKVSLQKSIRLMQK